MTIDVPSRRPPPHFVIGGAPRSGTTWLYHLLDRHPSVHMARPVQPEPKFFLVDELYERGVEYYVQRWFAEVPEETIAGEKSTNYLEQAHVAARIHRCRPDVRLIFSLREPAERAYSNYLWSRMNGMEDEDFATALELESEREAACPPELRYARPHAYYSRGLYARHLEPYFERFDADRIHCLKFEDIVEKPGQVARTLHAFLGVEPRPDDAASLGPINTSEGDEAPDPQIMRALRESYEEPNRRLDELLGHDFDVWEYDHGG